LREHHLADAASLRKEREERVARQKARLEKLEQGGHRDLAREARHVLELLEAALHETKPAAA
jgi:hypothetical protein